MDKLICKICNKTYSTVRTYKRHCTESHCIVDKDLIINYYESILVKDYGFTGIRVLDFRNTPKSVYLTIYNGLCGHTSEIRFDHIKEGQLCTDISCVTKNHAVAIKQALNAPGMHEKLSKINKEKQNQELTRLKKSLRAKENWTNNEYITKFIEGYYSRDGRLRRLHSAVNYQKRKSSKDELFVIKKLEEYSINYVWQYILLLKEYTGFDYIIDFYLPDYGIFLNIDGRVHEVMDDIKNKDLLLKNFLGDSLVQLKDIAMLDTLLLELLQKGEDIMGVNYYAIKNKVSLYNYPIHIGKSSAGWKFLFRGYVPIEDSELVLKSIEDWKEFLSNKEFVILDEYDRLISYEEFFNMVEQKQSEDNKDNFTWDVNVGGYRFSFRDFS